MQEKIGAQSRKDPGASSVLDGGRPVLSEKVAEKRDRVSGQELTDEGGRAHADLASRAKERELGAWKQFKVYPPAQMRAQTKVVVDSRWALT